MAGRQALSSLLRVLHSHHRKFSTASFQSLRKEWLPVDPKYGTLAVHAGYNPKEHPNGPLVQPISLATTFEQDSPGQFRGHHYIRLSNPTRDALEKTVAALDGGKYGYTYASGCAAMSNVVSLLREGDGIVVIDDVYGGTGALFRHCAHAHNLDLQFVDLTMEGTLEKALKANTKLIWIETPTNPLLKITDIQKAVSIAKGYSKDIIVAVDNTLMTSFFQKPLSLGADLSVYSLTKGMNGHTDVLMGAIVTNRDDLADRLSFIQKALGAVPSPFDSYMVLRGLKTLHVRMPLHMQNALDVTNFLQTHPKVDKVIHPGLPSHPQYETARNQSSGHSGLFSFYLKSKTAGAFFKNLQVAKLATSFGGFETMVELPIMGSKASVPPELRAQLGITENLIRFSAGLESFEDIKADLERALDHVEV